jgi:hypothetical protein
MPASPGAEAEAATGAETEAEAEAETGSGAETGSETETGPGESTAAPSSLSLRLDVDFSAREATMAIDDGSEPIRLVFDGEAWRPAAP